MHSDFMSQEVARFFEEANELQWKKNRDYHPDRVAFLEILRTAAETGISVEQDLWAKIRKQYIALRGYMIDGKIESESPRSRMTDIAVYMGMAAFWDLYKHEIVRDALRFIEDHTVCESIPSCMRTFEACERCRFKNWLESECSSNFNATDSKSKAI